MPTVETTRFVRKPFYVDAVQVTAENIDAVAVWCNGDIVEVSKTNKHIRVRVLRALNERQTKAYIGDWILYAGTGYKVYTPAAFAKSFDMFPIKSEEETERDLDAIFGPERVKFFSKVTPKDNDSSYSRVFALVREAMLNQDAATYHGNTSDGPNLEDLTRDIINVVKK